MWINNCVYIFNGFWWWFLWIIYLDYIIFLIKIYVFCFVYIYFWFNLWVVYVFGFDRFIDLSKNVIEIFFIFDGLLCGCNFYFEEIRKCLFVLNRIFIFLFLVMVNFLNIVCLWMLIVLVVCSVGLIWKVNFFVSKCLNRWYNEWFCFGK